MRLVIILRVQTVRYCISLFGFWSLQLHVKINRCVAKSAPDNIRLKDIMLLAWSVVVFVTNQMYSDKSMISGDFLNLASR